MARADAAGAVPCRRPLKLAGWELWLCGESEGRLFVPVDSKDDVATAFDGSDMSPSVVKKAVTTSKSVDVNVLVKSGYRAEQVAQDPINHVSHACRPDWSAALGYGKWLSGLCCQACQSLCI